MVFVIYLMVLSMSVLHCNCLTTTLTPVDPEIVEGNDVTFVCTVSAAVHFVNWQVDVNATFNYATAMGVQNGTCTLSSPTAYLLDTTKYSYNCSNTVYHVTVKNVQRSQHNYGWSCLPEGHSSGSKSTIKVKVPVSSVSITPTSPKDVIENTAIEFTCQTSPARPNAKVTWYKEESGIPSLINQTITSNTADDDFSVTTSTLKFVPSRQQNGIKIFCKAENAANKSPKESNKKTLNVLYKATYPVITQGKKFLVIEGHPGILSCYTSGGNPTPTLSWSCNNLSPTKSDTSNIGNITKTITWRAVRGSDTKCSCTFEQTGFPNIVVNVIVTVLYPPSPPKFQVNGKTINDDIKFIVNKARTIQCVTDSNPPPHSYKWYGPKTNDEQNLTFNSVQKTHAGNYTCKVKNTMNPSSDGIISGSNSSSVKLVVLFPPTVQNMATISKLEGSPLAFSCTYTVGFPTDTTVKWTRDVDGRTWNQQLLSISNITKEDTGHYQCNVSNTMQPTGDSQSFTGSDVKAFYLNVLYKASITKFVIDGLTENAVTVNERDPVPFVCDVDSNPLALVTLKNTNGLLKSVTADTLNYNNEAATCIDADTYTCSARNDYNGGIESIKTIKLFVNCRPRSAAVVDQNRTCERKAQYKFTFNAIAYPVPNFTWWKLVDDTWTQLESNDDYLIQSSDLQTNFTIHSVQPRDFTNYKLVANNTIDIFEQIYTLSENDKPDDIKQFKHLDDLTTTTSIGLTWKPGSNGGLPQTFHIRYKKSSTTTWNYVNINDTGDHVMNYTITGLTDKTQYDVVIYASNRKGNSEESALIALTKEREETSSYIFGIAGGVGGAVAVGAGVFVVILNVRRNRLLKRKKENETELNRRSVAEDSDEEDDKTTKKNGKTSKDNATGDLYENVGHMINDRNDSKLYVNLNELSRPKVPKKNVNKDGLIYADVVFQDQPNGRKNIIIGDESTPYSQIDFTKKADPLPDLDDKNA